jgi:hypothetical protein
MEPPEATLPPAAEEEQQLPGGADVSAALARTLKEQELREEELKFPTMIKAREDSRLAYSGLDSFAEAAALLRSTFVDQLSALNQDPGRFLSDAQLEQRLGPTTARVSEEGEHALLEAGVPVQARDEDGALRKVDLALADNGEGFIAANPLVDFEIPTEPQDGIDVATSAGNLRIKPVGEGNSKGIKYGDQNAFFPNIDDDRDLLVAPIAKGIETFDQLRSVNSPERLRYELDLPAGSILTSDGAGGANVVQGDEILVHIPFPTAVDAQGANVPVHLDIDGDAMVLEVKHRDRSVAYPLLVDPSYELSESWYWYGNANLAALGDGTWQWGSNVGWIHGSTSCIYACWGSGRGLFVSTPNGAFMGNQFGQWTYTPPGSTSYVTGANLNPFWRDNHNCSKNQYPQPHDYAGIWTDGVGWNIFRPDYANEYGQAQLSAIGRVLVVGLGTGPGGSSSCWRDIMLGGASVWISDPDNPTWNGAPSVSPTWTHTTMLPISVSASDPGLGVKYFNLFTADGAGNPASFIGNSVHPCSGLKASPCPGSWSTQITNYNPASLPTGINALALRAYDPLHEVHYAGQAVFLKVDHASPVIKTSGELLSPSPIKYHLEVDAEDGSSASLGTAQSGMKKLEFYLDEQYQGAWPNETPGNCVNVQQGLDLGSCKFEGVDVDLPRALEGPHTLKIVAIDSYGHKTTKVHNLNLPKDVTAPQATVSGPLKDAPGKWVAAKASSLTVEATDVETGVTKATVFVDGEEVVTPAVQECKYGGCPFEPSFTVDLLGYEEGPHAVKAVVYDGAGNATQTMWTVSVDPVGPKLDLTTTPEIPSGWTPQLTSLGINFKALDTTAGGNGSGIAKVEALVPIGESTLTQTLYSSTCNGTAESPCQQEATGSKATMLFSVLTQGTVQMPIKAYDLAGNVSTQTLTLKIDRTAPTVKATGPLVETPLGTLVGGSSKLDLTITDTGSGTGSVELLLDGNVEETMTLEEIEADGGKQTCTAPPTTCTLTYSFVPEIGHNLASGNHTLVIRAKDLAERTGTLSKEVTLDTKGPKLDLTTTPEIPSGWTPQLTSLGINFKALDTTAGGNGSGIAKVEALVPIGESTLTQTLYSSTCNGTAESPCQQEATGSKATMLFSVLTQGTVQMPIKAYDLAGNVSTQTLTLKIDRTAPTVKATGPLVETPLGTLVGGSSKLDLTITDTGSGTGSVELLLDGNVEETMTLEEIEADGGKQTCTAPPTTCTLTYSFVPEIGHNLASGNHTLVIRAKDLAERTGTLSKEVTLDTGAPEASLSGLLVESAGQELEAAEADLKVVATDPGSGFTSGIKWIVIAVDGQQVAAVDNCKATPCSASAELSYAYKETEWGNGPHEVEVLVSDWVGTTIERRVAVNSPITAVAPECPTGPQETVEAAGVVTPAEASQLFEMAVPPAVAPTEPSANEPTQESPFNPSVAEEGQHSINEQGLDVVGTPTGGGIEDVPAGSFTVGQALCMQPVQKTSATSAPVEVGDDAVLYANSAPETDTVVRPSAYGTTIVEHRRGPMAPSSFSWEVKLGPGEELRKLANGSVVVVTTGVDINGVEVPSTVPDLDPSVIPDVEAQLTRLGANLAEANNAVEGEVTAVIAPPQAVLDTGATEPALLQISGGTIVTAALPPNVVVDTVALIIEANTAPEPAAMCAHAFSPTPELYVDGCGEDPEESAEPPASPDEWEELNPSSWEPVIGSGGAQLLINSPSLPIDHDKAWCASHPAHPAYCAYFNEDKRIAEERTAKLFNRVEDGTKANAFQHSYWVAVMVNSKPPDNKAFDFAMNHEKSQENDPERSERYNSRMDKLNNRVGYKYATNNAQSDQGACEAMVSKIGPAIYVGRQRNPAAYANKIGWQAYSVVYRIKYVGGVRIHLVSQNCN